MVEPAIVPCQECRVELASYSPDLRLSLPETNEPLVFGEASFGERASR